MSSFFRQSQDDTLKRNKSLTRIDRVRSFLGKKGKTQSLISFFDQSSSTEDRVSSYQYIKRSSQNLSQKDVTRSSLFKSRRTQSQHLEKKEITCAFGVRSPSLYASTQLALKGPPSGSEKMGRLYTPPSMSFPSHLRSKSHTAANILAHGPMSSSPTELPQSFSVQPWWDSRDASHEEDIVVSTPQEVTPSFLLTSQSSSFHALGVISQDDMETRCQMPSRTSSCLLPLLDSHNPCFEISICSDSSYATCPTPLLDEDYSEGGSTPTLLSDSPMMLPMVKDACQSPLTDLYAFPNSRQDGFANMSESIDDNTEQTDGLAIEDIDTNVSRFIELDQPGRQERLRQYTSIESLKQTPLIDLSTTSGKYVQKQLSLTDFLHELRKMPTEMEEQVGDVSLSSSLMAEEEVDSVQICRAWRQNIAFGNLGASHKNGPLDEDIVEVPSCTSVGFVSRAVSQKPSRVSLRSLPLETIEEMDNTTATSEVQNVTTTTTTSSDESDEPVDVCAHLLQRAKNDIHARKST